MIASGIQKIDEYNIDSMIPIAKVLYTDSPYGVNSIGYAVDYYNNSDGSTEFDFDSDDIIFRGHDNILSYDWSYGVPPGVTNIYFKARFYGYFYAEFDGDYRFMVSTDPSNKVRFFMDAVTPDSAINASGIFSEEGYLRIENFGSNGAAWSQGVGANETWYQTIPLAGGFWYAWGLEFINTQDKANLVLRYIEPHSTLGVDTGRPSDHDPFYRSGHNGIWGWTDDDEPVNHLSNVFHPKVMSAGITNYRRNWENDSEAGFETPVEIAVVNHIDGAHDLDKSSEFTLTVPINSDPYNSNAEGFALDPDTGLYTEQATNITLRHGRKIAIYFGYQSKCIFAGGSSCNHSNAHIVGYYGATCESGGNYKCPANDPLNTDYIQCFEGIVTDVAISEAKKTNQLKITCQDQMTFMLNAINENYPNDISYAQFNFISDRKSRQPNGLTRPNTYDGWPLSSAVRDLCIKSKIDPVWLYGRKRIIDANSNIIYGDYFIDDYGLLLRRKSKYGNPLITDIKSSDEEYIWSYNFGEKIHSMITKMADLYGYTLRITQGGYVQCGPIDAPKIHVPDWAYDSDGNVIDNSWNTSNQEWAAKVDSRADGGRYYECGISHTPLKKILTGSKFQIGIIRDFPVTQDTMVWDNIYRHKDGSESEWLGAGLHNYVYSGGDESLGSIVTHYKFRDWFHAFSVNMTIQTQNMYIRINRFDEVHKFADGVLHSGKHNEIQIHWYFYIVNDPTDLVNATAENIFENNGSLFTLYEDGILSLPSAPHEIINDYVLTIPFSAPPNLIADATYAIKFVQEDTNPGSVVLWPNEKWDFKSPIQGVKQEQPDNTVVTAVYRDIAYTGGGYEVNKSYGKNINNLPVYLNIWADGIVEFEAQYSTCRIDVYRDNTDEHVATFSTTNWYDGYISHADNLRFPRDGSDISGINPCLVNVPSTLLQSGEYNGIMLSYDTYRFEITHSGDDGVTPTKITSIYSYSDDIDIPVYHFDTFKNIQKINSKSTIEDMRNDIIVIGNKLGKVEDIDGEVINRNNPTYDYVYSRATDAASIYQLDAINNVGRQTPFIIMESAITDQRHADWLAEAVLHKYRLFKITPGWSSIGYPFIEPCDPVYIRDVTSNTMYDSRMQWLLSCKHSFDYGKYQMTLSSTPYRPWSSYTPRPKINIEDFKDEEGNPQPFINIRMVTSFGGYCGSNLIGHNPFDVYAVEESGYRLKVTFDQIIDGFVTVKVFKNGVTNPVAWLTGSVSEDGFEKDEYKERGYNYELFWDCTDETSASKMDVAIDSDETWQYIDNFKTEQGLYTASGDYYLVFKLAPIEQNEGLDEEKNRYVVSTKKLPVALNKSVANTLGFTEGTYTQYWNVKWGDPVFGVMNVYRPKIDGTYEECTYPHLLSPVDNYGLSFEMMNDPAGIKFEFEFLNDKPRLVYFNVNAQIIRGTAIESPILTSGMMRYVRGMWHSYLGVKSSNPRKMCNLFATTWSDPEGLVLDNFVDKYEYWTYAAGAAFSYFDAYGQGYLPVEERDPFIYFHNYTYGNRDANVPYYDTLKQLSTESDHEENHGQLTCMDKYLKFDEDAKKVTFWSQEAGMPYEDIDTSDYIKAFSKKVTSHNDVVFTYNPNRLTQVDVDFHKIPKMGEQKSELFKQALATMIWITSLAAKNFNGSWNEEININRDEMKPTIYIATYTQPIIRVWDKTGRYINSTQSIYNGPISHHHTKMSNCTNENVHYVSEGLSLVHRDEVRATFYSSKFDFSNCGFSTTSNHEHPEFIRTCWLPLRRHSRFVPCETKKSSIISDPENKKWNYLLHGGLRYGDFNATMFYHEMKKVYMYNMTVDGLGVYHNWGIGQVNGDKLGAPPGAFTWHSYVKVTIGGAGHELTNIPFDTTNIRWTDHWRAYINDDDNYPPLFFGSRTTSRIVGACDPESYKYTHANAQTNLTELFIYNYLNQFGSIFVNQNPDEPNNVPWEATELKESYEASGYTAEQFHIHLPVAETMPLWNMDYMFYAAIDDDTTILDRLMPNTSSPFFNGETQGDWMIAVGSKKSNYAPKLATAGTAMKPDSVRGANSRTWLGASVITPFDTVPNYPNQHGNHYAWYRNTKIQIPDWHVPADLTDWETIPHVLSFGLTWGF